MTASVSRGHGMTLAYQLNMASHILPADVWEKVKAKIPQTGNHPGRLFHRRQLWFLLQLTVVACNEDPPAIEPMEMQRRAGLAALMASDVLGQIELAQTADLVDESEVEQWATTNLMPLIDQRPGDEILCRAICFWIDMQADPVVRKKLQQIQLVETLDEYFAKEHGMTLREFVNVITVAYVVYAVGADADPPEVSLLTAEVMSGTPYPVPIAAKAISLVGIAPDDLATSLMLSRQSWATDFSPLRGKPLLEVLPGQYGCADAGVFTLFYMDGIYSLLEKALSKDKFRDLFGTMFECYINRLFNAFLYSGSTLVRQFAANPKFIGENSQAADGIALLGKITLLIEYKGGMLAKRQRYGTDIEETIKGVNSLLARTGNRKKGVGQLVDNIARLLRGDKIHSGGNQIEIPDDSVIIPTIVVYDDNLGIHAVRSHVDKQFRLAMKERELSDERVGPLSILTTRDIECLQEFASVKDVSAIIENYCRHIGDSPRDLAGSFHSFLFEHCAKAVPTESFVRTRVGEFLEQLQALMESCRAMKSLTGNAEERSSDCGLGGKKAGESDLRNPAS